MESLVNSYISLVFTHDNMTNIQTLLCRSFCMSLEAEVLISSNRQTVNPSNRQTVKTDFGLHVTGVNGGKKYNIIVDLHLQDTEREFKVIL